MSRQLMVLPSVEFKRIRVVLIPEDLEVHEAYRFATGIIAQAEESSENYGWEEISEALEARGFEPVDAMIGPTLD